MSNGEPSRNIPASEIKAEQKDLDPITQQIQADLDKFAQENNIKSLRDRLRIGLNIAGMLGWRETNKQIQELCEKSAESEIAAQSLYEDLKEMSLKIQQGGPWDYADDFREPDKADPAVRTWLSLYAAETIGYENEMDLSEQEFLEHVERIKGHLSKAAANPAQFYQEAKKAIFDRANKHLRFAKEDKGREVPISEGLGGFLDMAVAGYKAGVAHDAQGWVYVGSQNEISDDLLESCGLHKVVEEDVKRDAARTATFFKNDQGETVIKKLYPGFLVVLSRNFELASDVVKAVNREDEVLEVSQSALGHVRYTPTSKGAEDWNTRIFHEEPSGPVEANPEAGGQLLRLKDRFYQQMKYIKGRVIYVDSLRHLEKKRENKGAKVTAEDKEKLVRTIDGKMEQKMDELRHMMQFIEPEIQRSQDIHKVIDMAGGAGDLGLNVATEMLATGKELDKVEIVDPEYGDFMDLIIEYLPFREELEQKAHHTGSALQEAAITPDSIVVAKHACGTLTDDIIEQWRESDSSHLVMMTCCQDKAKDRPARYGVAQEDWHDWCKASAKTNIELSDLPEAKRAQAEKELAKGKQAMENLDMARVRYLRRMGFAAELHTTDKFPKGDVIVARRLPENFSGKLRKLKRMEIHNPIEFDNYMRAIDQLAKGRDPKGLHDSEFGQLWQPADFEELRRRFAEESYPDIEAAEPEPEKSEGATAGKSKEAKQEEKSFINEVFGGAAPNIYVVERRKAQDKPLAKGEIGKLVGRIMSQIKELKQNNPDISAVEVRSRLDEMEL